MKCDTFHAAIEKQLKDKHVVETFKDLLRCTHDATKKKATIVRMKKENFLEFEDGSVQNKPKSSTFSKVEFRKNSEHIFYTTHPRATQFKSFEFLKPNFILRIPFQRRGNLSVFTENTKKEIKKNFVPYMKGALSKQYWDQIITNKNVRKEKKKTIIKKSK